MRLAISIFAVLAVLPLVAVELGAPFSDGVVLQCGRQVPVWGFAEPSERVTVSFAGQTHETVSDSSGEWRVDFAPLASSSEGRTMTVSAASGSVRVGDVLVGEVWLCSGQSNMEAPLCNTNLHFADMKGALRAQMTRKPLVRYCRSAPKEASPIPLRKTARSTVWKKCVPENLGPECFSAVGIYFALELHQALGVPVGIVGAYWGGTSIYNWTPRCGLEAVAETAEVARKTVYGASAFAEVVEDAKKRGVKSLPQYHRQPTVLFNAQVAPFAPMAMRGVIWYQGETDGGLGFGYRPCLQAFYRGWSKWFENAALKLRIVQLAPAGGELLAPIMEAQAEFARETPNVAMAVACDRGALHDWHPNDKEPIGMRLAALALRHDYGFEQIKADAPQLRSWRCDEDRVILSFAHASSWMLYNEDWSNDNYFEVAGEDGAWHSAEIVNMKVREKKPYVSNGMVEGADVVISSPFVKSPRKVRYLYRPPYRANLFNEAGLPLGPFHLEIPTEHKGGK